MKLDSARIKLAPGANVTRRKKTPTATRLFGVYLSYKRDSHLASVACGVAILDSHYQDCQRRVSEESLGRILTFVRRANIVTAIAFIG